MHISRLIISMATAPHVEMMWGWRCSRAACLGVEKSEGAPWWTSRVLVNNPVRKCRYLLNELL